MHQCVQISCHHTATIVADASTDCACNGQLSTSENVQILWWCTQVWQTRTLLPASPSQLKSSGPHPAEAQEALQRTKDKQAQNYNRSAKSLPELQVGDTVRVQTDRGPWEKGFVLDRAGTPRSYIIQLESGSQIRRNRRHLRKSLEPFRLRSGSPDDLDEPEQPQPEAAADEQPPPNPDPPPDAAAPKTRSGRVTRRPGYLSDYQTE